MIEATAIVSGVLGLLWLFMGALIAIETSSGGKGDVLFFYWSGVIVLGTIFTLALVAATGEDSRETRALDRKLRSICEGKPVTNRVKSDEINDNRIVFDCANDGKLRVVKNG